MPNEKVMIILLTVGLIKKILLYKMSHLPVYLLDLSNYPRKSDLKNTTDT